MKRGLIFGLALIQVFFVSCRRNEFSFVFLPDLHLRPDTMVEAHFDSLVAEINKIGPDFILTGGDMIYTAKNVGEEKAGNLFDFMEKKMEGFSMPVHYTMGNHETVGILAESGMDTSHPMWGKGMYEKLYGKRYYSFIRNGWKFIVLDGIKVLEKERNYTQGFDSVEVEWLKNELKSTERSLPLAVAVHTPLVNPHAVENSQVRLLSVNNDSILHLFKEHNLKLVLEGHTHMYMNLFFNGIHYISGGSTAYSSGYDNNHSGFVIVRVKGEKIDSEFINYPAR